MRLVLSSVLTFALALAATPPAAAQDEPAPAPADVTITTTPDEVTYDDAALADADTVSVEGTLRVAFVESLGTDGRPEVETDYAIVTDRGDTVPIEPAEDLPVEAANGAIDAEVADEASGAAPLAEATVVTSPAVSAAPAATGAAHRAYVVRVGKTGALPDAAELTAELQAGVLDEWVAESEGAIPSFTVAGVSTLPAVDTSQSRSTLCAMNSVDRVWTEAEEMFPSVSFDAASGNHLVVLTSADCGSGPGVGIGIGTVGTSIASGGLVSLQWRPGLVRPTGVHEIGHNVGLLHANAKACATCQAEEYYDLFSVMGFSVAGAEPPALDTASRDRLGLVQPGEVTRLSRPGAGPSVSSVRVEPRGAGAGVRALRVVDPVSRDVFWVENRAGGTTDRDAASAYDPFYVATPFSFAPGVTVTTANADGSLDLIAHEAGSIDEGSLRTGRSWTSPTGAVTVTVDATVPGGPADVTVGFAGTVANTFTTPAPRIGGTAKVGRTLTAVHGTWVPRPGAFRYQWFSGSTPIAGATGKTYTVPGAQRAKQLKVRITGSLADYPDTSVTSAPTSRVLAGSFSAPTPRIGGTAKVGRTLTAVHGTWSPAPTTFRYQWWVGSRAITGATGKTYKVPASLAGTKVRVRIRGSRPDYVTGSFYSSFTATISR